MLDISDEICRFHMQRPTCGAVRLPPEGCRTRSGRADLGRQYAPSDCTGGPSPPVQSDGAEAQIRRSAALAPPDVALICRTPTAFSVCESLLFLEKPTARNPKPFVNADGHDLAPC